jgi:lipoate---protein ligase
VGGWAEAWRVTHLSGGAGDLHGRDLELGGRTVTVLEVDRPAVVLGSTQPESDVDADACAAMDVDVVRRRSGGGAVLLLPGRSVWVDVTITRDDPLWDDDVGRASHWLGAAWAGAAVALGCDGATVHTGRIAETAWSRRVCFAGLGPGEVVVGGRKLVGISQRRTREGARFQCVLHRVWDPVGLLGLLALDEGERVRGLVELADVGTGLDLPAAAVVAALEVRLPRQESGSRGWTER